MPEEVNDIIKRLVDIEDTAVRIVESAEDEKGQLKAEMEKEMLKFDEEVEKDVADKIEMIRLELLEDEKNELAKLKSETEEALKKLEELYEEKHDMWVDRIFQSIVEV